MLLTQAGLGRAEILHHAIRHLVYLVKVVMHLFLSMC
jgi:hypothetical protein